jgi:hypothetical protein
MVTKGQVIYFTNDTKGLINKIARRKAIFLSRKCQAVAGFFQIDEIDERDSYIFVTGKNVTPSTLADLNIIPSTFGDNHTDDFLKKYPHIDSLAIAESDDGIKFLILQSSYLMDKTFIQIDGIPTLYDDNTVIPDDYRIVRYALNDCISNFQDIYLGRCFDRFGRAVNSKDLPQWVREGLGISSNNNAIPTLESARVLDQIHNLPIIVREGYELEVDLERVKSYNLSILKYWKHTGLKSLGSPSEISKHIKYLNRHPMWSSI